MGKNSHMKSARRTTSTPPPSAAARAAEMKRKVFTFTLIGAIIAIVVVGVIIATQSSTTAPKASGTISSADASAPASLIKAAQEVGFAPRVEPGTGLVEDKPASAGQPPSSTEMLAVGTTAPDFTLKTPIGDSVSLASFKGKAVLVEFFATWCPHCDANQPYIETLYASLPKSQVAFVAINADGETAPSVYAYHVYYGMTYPALLDPSSKAGSFTSPGAAGPVTTAYRVQYFPTFYIVDAAGKIAWRGDGEQPTALLKQELLKAAGA
ncbi:MAG: redoxin family protein [Actinobacteria bacterium]|uniref:Unannotated protein n=1 Tax=freshwater metagenome TaxID=449393 RepID=A0A6J6NFQ2_9ZZZZ|nr:redoxin family protein [Actinomycetota bacterium]